MTERAHLEDASIWQSVRFSEFCSVCELKSENSGKGEYMQKHITSATQENASEWLSISDLHQKHGPRQQEREDAAVSEQSELH